MKKHGKIDPDGKRRADVWVDPDGGYILASRIGAAGQKRMRESREYRLERYEVNERGEIIEELPPPSDVHQVLRLERLNKSVRKPRSQNPTPPPQDVTPSRSKSKGQGGSESE